MWSRTRLGGRARPLVTQSLLAEGEDIRLDSGLPERDLQRPLADRVAPAHELVEAAVPEQAAPVLVDVDAVRGARRLAVEEHTEPNRRSRPAREHEGRVARGEAGGDAAAGPV